MLLAFIHGLFAFFFALALPACLSTRRSHGAKVLALLADRSRARPSKATGDAGSAAPGNGQLSTFASKVVQAVHRGIPVYGTPMTIDGKPRHAATRELKESRRHDANGGITTRSTVIRGRRAGLLFTRLHRGSPGLTVIEGSHHARESGQRSPE